MLSAVRWMCVFWTHLDCPCANFFQFCIDRDTASFWVLLSRRGTRFETGVILGFSLFTKMQVGVGFDLQTHCTSFFVNGKKVLATTQTEKILLFRFFLPFLKKTKRQTTEGKTGEFRIGSNSYTLFPAVCLFSVRKQKMCSVTFDFHGPFVALPPLFQALAKRE